MRYRRNVTRCIRQRGALMIYTLIILLLLSLQLNPLLHAASTRYRLLENYQDRQRTFWLAVAALNACARQLPASGELPAELLMNNEMPARDIAAVKAAEPLIYKAEDVVPFWWQDVLQWQALAWSMDALQDSLGLPGDTATPPLNAPRCLLQWIDSGMLRAEDDAGTGRAFSQWRPDVSDLMADRQGDAASLAGNHLYRVTVRAEGLQRMADGAPATLMMIRSDIRVKQER